MKRRIAFWLAPKLSPERGLKLLEWGTGERWAWVRNDGPLNEGDVFLPDDTVCRWVRSK